MNCPICDGSGWMEAAPVTNRVTGEGEKAVVGTFTPTPCFNCYPTLIGVIA